MPFVKKTLIESVVTVCHPENRKRGSRAVFLLIRQSTEYRSIFHQALGRAQQGFQEEIHYKSLHHHLLINGNLSIQPCQGTPLISSLGSLRHEGSQCQASLGYIVRPFSIQQLQKQQSSFTDPFCFSVALESGKG